MKILRSIYYWFFLAVIVVSCDSMLKVQPQNKLKPSTVSDYNELLNYGYPSGTGYSDQVPLDFYVLMMTDDVDLRYFEPDRNPYPYIPYTFSKTHDDPSMLGGRDKAWKNLYKSIYYANVVLQNIDEAEGELQKKLYLKGEAMVLRAFAYFKLINIYAQPYNAETASEDLGVPLKLDPTVKAESYTRASVQAIYDQIDKDLTKGIQLMEENDIRLTTKYKFTPISAHLLASRIALFKKDYETTIAQATKVIEANPRVFDLSGYDLQFARTSWGYGQGTNYLSAENDNVLFVFGTNPYYRYFYFPGGLALSNELVNLFELGDLRLYYFTRGQPGGGLVYYKYRPYPFYIGLPVRGFRVEEAYLNRAEAYAETGELEKALADLNYIRNHKFDVDYYEPYSTSQFSSQEEVIQTVREERRRELCFEFHRWYDLRRYGMPKIVHVFQGETYILNENDLRYVLQIPERELDYNPEMQKNPR